MLLASAAGASLGAGLAVGSDGPVKGSGSSPSRERAEAASGAVAGRQKPPAIRRISVGRGSAGAVIIARGPVSATRPLIVFLHGWGVPIRRYDPWIDHLVRVGNTVVAPRYQSDEHADPGLVRDAAIAGLRRALRRLRVQRGSVLYAGHSAGGALAADLAAVASSRSLPRPAGVFALYPGRAILGYPAGIPAAPLSRLPSSTRLLALAGADDRIVAQAPAQQMISSATSLPSRRRRYVLVRDRRVDDHLGPTRHGTAARSAFWRRLDRLAVRARR